MRTSVWLVRHGQTSYNKAGRYQGRSDPPLTEYGQQQAQAVARRLQRLSFTAALLSPCNRVYDTAAPILAGRSGVKVSEEPDWQETAHGGWEGLTYREVLDQYPDEVRTRFADDIDAKPAGGESLREVAERIQAAWDNLLEEHPNGRILVVTHATPVQLVLCTTFGVPISKHWRWRIDLGSVTCLDVYGDAVIARVINEVPHLLPLADDEDDV